MRPPNLGELSHQPERGIRCTRSSRDSQRCSRWAHSPSAGSHSRRQAASEPDRLFGGGRFEFDFDPGPNELILPREFSLQAESRNGKNGFGTRIYGNPDQPEPATPNIISCLNIEGRHAVIGGLDPAGTPYVQYFDDLGTAGKAPSDGITPVLNMSAQDVERLMPKQFPDVCPSTVPPAAWDNFWTTLESGDIAVVDR